MLSALGANGWSAPWWKALRGLLGAYLAVHFVGLLPAATEVFSSAGMATAAYSPLFSWVPSPLWISTAPAWVLAWVVTGAGAGVVLVFGGADRLAAGLALWVLASLFAVNPLISNPSLPHVGWMLLAVVVLPPGPRLGDRHRSWSFPPEIFTVSWVVMTLAYAYSATTKLAGPSWLDGSALQHVLENPLARPTGLRSWLLARPGLLQGATWAAWLLELLAPVGLWPRARPVVWSLLLLLQVGLLVLVDFADLTWGMLVLQAFTFDPAWLDRAGARTGPPGPPSRSSLVV